ncbi:hypothetical protein O4J56_23730 [Nocardiopsis sp. RSe5-2]|uniref:Uncharacterized protein n=1 Tax=Nocardiopsis endophytica TaxID=3018445 RepID=A0ABT4U9Q2_9ACTN|nr:hypothetical protein [Nocardiopsis endophytica]MDA2813675.1 hypothetical protein [Nocardiopsis endophytica]
MDTLDLLRRYWAPLLCVWLAGDIVYRLLLRGMAKAAAFEPVLGYVALGVLLLVQLATYIIMFHMLRPALPTVDAEYQRVRSGALRDTAQRGSVALAERTIVDAIAMAILPFLIFYSAWDLYAEEYRKLTIAAVNEEGLDTLLDLGTLDHSGPMLVIAAAAFGLRALFEHYYKKNDNKFLGLGTALFEATWMFMGTFTLVSAFTEFWKWAKSRAAWVVVQDGIDGAVNWASVQIGVDLQDTLLQIYRSIDTTWSIFKDGFLQPLVWLTITAVVFGAQMDRYSGLFNGKGRTARLERVLTSAKGPVAAVRTWMRKDAGDKYIPFINAFKFILSVSPVFYLSFSLYYVLVMLGTEWMERGFYLFFGPDDWFQWWPWLEPVSVVTRLVQDLLRICLLAATFELILFKVGGRSTGRRARRAAPLPEGAGAPAPPEGR